MKSKMGKTITIILAAGALLLALVFFFYPWAREIPPETRETSPKILVPEKPSPQKTRPKPLPLDSTQGEKKRSPGPIQDPPLSSRDGLAHSSLLEAAFAEIVTPGLSSEAKAECWRKFAEEGILEDLLDALERKADEHPEGEFLRLFAEGAAWLGTHESQDPERARAMAERAARAYERLLERHPRDWKVRFGQAALLVLFPQDQGRQAEGRTRLEELVQWQEARDPRPGFSRAYLLLGDSYRKEGNLEKARQIWLKGLEFFPEDRALKERVGR